MMSLMSSMRHSLQSTGHPTQILRIYPIVVDANVLLNDLMYTVKKGRATSLIEAARIGTIRIFAPAHVFDEVPEHLVRRSRAARVDPFEAYQHWRDDYLDVIQFVDVPKQVECDPRERQVRARDPDDAPTAALAILLAPILSLSEDRHLLDYDLATKDWLLVTQAGRTTAQADAALFGGAVGLSSVIALIDYAVSHPRTRIMLGAAGFLGIGITAFGWRTGRLKDLLAHLSGDRFWDVIASLSLMLSDARARLEDSRIEGSESKDDLATIACHLAVAPEACTATDIVRAHHPSHQAPRQDVRRMLKILEESTLFVRIGPSRWQIGSVWAPRACAGCPLMEKRLLNSPH